MFGIGLPELAVLAFIGVIVFGPDKLPELAKQAAHLTKRAKRLADGARDELRSGLGPEYADLEIRDLDPRSLVRRHLSTALEDDEDDTEDEGPDVRVADEDGTTWLAEGDASEDDTPVGHFSRSTTPTSLARRSRRRSAIGGTPHRRPHHLSSRK